MDTVFFILFFYFPSLLLFFEVILQVFFQSSFLSNGVKIFFAFDSMIFLSWVFLVVTDTGQENDCCSDSAFFSPDHRLSIYVLIILCTVSYFYSSFRKILLPPLFELLTNCFLVVGIVLNILILMQFKNGFFIGLPVILANICLFILELYRNHQLILADTNNWDTSILSSSQNVVLTLLKSSWFIKFPLLLFVCLPLLVILSSILLLSGQKPDSFIRAFTDTYKHGFSQLDYMCDNVVCGGHYLCSVAANGHEKVVKPVRIGERGGGKILCNRQLLISNAFEEIIEERFPALHRFIRKNYDKMGDLIHRNYKFFNNRYFSDTVYYLMKPLEWIFLIVIYLVDRKPENRIASQYLSVKDRNSIKQNLKGIFFDQSLCNTK